MPAIKVTCPHCGKHLKMSKPLEAGHRALCSRCGHSFTAPAQNAVGAVAPPLHAVNSETAAAMPAPASNGQVLAIALVLSGLMLLLLTTISLVLYFAFHKNPAETQVEAAVSAPSDDAASPSARPTEDVPSPPPPPPPAAGTRHEGPPLPPDLTPVPANSSANAEQLSWLPPEEQEQVNKTIDRGVRWLKEHQGLNGSWGRNIHEVGLTALPALTLLECGVPAEDACIQKALHHVRKAILHNNQTYELSLAILFLDRLGDPSDKKLIQTCALRLAAGQTAAGGWTYTCPILTEQQEIDLQTVMRQRRPKSALDLFVGGRGGSAPPGFLTRDPNAPLDKDIEGEPSGDSKLLPEGTPLPGGKQLDKDRPSLEEAKRALARLPSPLRKLPALQPPKESHKLPPGDASDNSNTQFAILGLLAAARHEVPLERTFALIVHRFHTSQVPDGRWNYHYSSPAHAADLRPAMTGAGLLGLAVQYGLAADHAQPRANPPRINDPAVEKGFSYLSQFNGKQIGWKKPRARNREPINLYFLWTVERCGVLYHQRQIDGKDWYSWGAELLLDHQRDDGSWNTDGYFAPAAITPTTDSCFALLFLKRANLAKDLTKKLEFFIEGKELHPKP
jgi:hypothetical protein